MTTRIVLGALGLLLAGYGGWLLLDGPGPAILLPVGTWLVAGVVLHDVVLTAVVLALTWVGTRLLPVAYHAPATVALVILGSLTLLAVPVLGRFGAVASDPWLLDRPYTASWLAVAGATVLLVVLAGEVRRRRGR